MTDENKTIAGNIGYPEFMRQWSVWENAGRAPVATIGGRYGKWLVWPATNGGGDFSSSDKPVTHSYREPFLHAQKVANSGSHSIRCIACVITVKAEELTSIETIPASRARRSRGSEFPK